MDTIYVLVRSTQAIVATQPTLPGCDVGGMDFWNGTSAGRCGRVCVT